MKESDDIDETSEVISNFPNGVFKHILSIFNAEDPEGVTIEWQVEIHDKANKDEF